MSDETELKVSQADEHHHGFDSNQSCANSRKRVILSPGSSLRGSSKLRKQTMDDDISMVGERRANFSALCSSISGSMKAPVNNSSKPGDIKKLVIKNFKSKFHIIFRDQIS